jgi:hypothetical protein
MRGPNTDRYLDLEHVSVAWVDLPNTLSQAFPTLSDADKDALSEIWADYRHGLSDAAEITYLKAEDERAQAITNLEDMTDKVARAITALPDQADMLERIFNLLVIAQIEAKQIEPDKVARPVPSVADTKTKTAQRLIAFASQRDLDARALVKAMGVHSAHSATAWEKWFTRCSASN